MEKNELIIFVLCHPIKKHPMKITDVMIPEKNFVFCSPEDNVQKVCGLIIGKHVGSVLVFDQNAKDFIGLVTKTGKILLILNSRYSKCNLDWKISS